MRIAQIAPLHEAVPPKLYGGTERVVSYLTEELVALGHQVTLFASGDSVTSACLHAVWPRSLRLDPAMRDVIAPHMLMMEEVRRRAEDFDVLQISEFPTGDFGSNRQAVSVETDRPFRSKAAPRCGWVLVPALANRRCVIHPILLWSAKASTLVIIIVFSDCCGRL